MTVCVDQEKDKAPALLPSPRLANHFVLRCGSLYLPPPINYQLHAWPDLISLPASSRRRFKTTPLAGLARPPGTKSRKENRVTLSFVFFFPFHQGEGLLHVLCPRFISVAALQRCKDVT